MAPTNNKLQDKETVEGCVSKGLCGEITDLQKEFTHRYNALIKAHFINKEGLKVIEGNGNYAIGFVIDYDLIAPRHKLQVVSEFSKELQPLVDGINSLFVKYNIVDVKATISFPIRNNQVQPITDYSAFPNSEKAPTNNKLQEQETVQGCVSKDLWYEIEENLGEVTDFRIDGDTIHFKSNGIDKILICQGDNNFKFLIQCAYYINALQNPLKRYKHAS